MRTPFDIPRLRPASGQEAGQGAGQTPAARAAAARAASAAMPSACESGGCGGHAPRMPPPPSFGDVRVNGALIAPEAIAQEIQHHPAPDAETAWTEAARALAIRELLLQEARRLGLRPDGDEDGPEEADEDALISALLMREVDPGTPGEAECRRYYEARRARFRTSDLFEVSHVLIEPEAQDEAGWEAALEQARGVIATVGDDARAFAEAARELSACPSAGQDGSLGQVRRGELVPEVQAAIEALEPGTARRTPVRSRFGWHVLRLARRIEGQVLPFEALEGKIAEMMAARGWTLASTRYVADLAARGRVEGISVEPQPDAAAL